MNKNNIFDLTPLLDVILILLFAILINGQFERAQATDAYASEIEALNKANQIEAAAQNQEILALKKDLEALEAASESDWTLEDIQTYDALKDITQIINVDLITLQNQLLIDGENTGIYVLKSQLDDPAQMETLYNRIQTTLKKHMRTNQTVLIILEGDTQIYNYAYTFVEKTLLDLVQSTDEERLHFLSIK